MAIAAPIKIMVLYVGGMDDRFAGKDTGGNASSCVKSGTWTRRSPANSAARRGSSETEIARGISSE